MDIRRAEYLLYNYLHFANELVALNEEEYQVVQFGAPKHHDSSGRGGSSTGSGLEGQLIRKEKELTRIHRQKAYLIRMINETESILDKVRSDKYYDIIRLIYFYGQSLERAAQNMKCGISTIQRNKKRLLRMMCKEAAGPERKAV